jgi:hypothetical protein
MLLLVGTAILFSSYVRDNRLTVVSNMIQVDFFGFPDNFQENAFK